MNLQELRIRLLPVGLGDAILVRFPDATWALIDCGWTDKGDTAAKVVALLNREEPADTPVRFVLATHPDSDHVARIPAFLALCPRRIQAFYHCGISRQTAEGATTESEDYVACAQRRSKAGLLGPVHRLWAGQTVRLDPPIEGLSIHVLNPDKKTVRNGPARTASARNNAAVVLQITYCGIVILLASDIESAAWGRVVRRKAFRPPHVLKVSHHGAKNGAAPPEVFAPLASTSLRWALFSTPTDDWSKPHRDILAWFWDRSDWRTRCTGWSPLCDEADRESYPEKTGSTKYPPGLGEALAVHGRGVLRPLRTLHGCCVDNEIIVTEAGTLFHSQPLADNRAKSCDNHAQKAHSRAAR
jgi:beta-lactamase superfamily II metal-dependent hydrolase